jgi:hypothetical protein
MNRRWCERESDAVQALRMGLLSAELSSHVLSCAICAEAQAVAQVMLRAASLRGAEHEPPAADLVWRRAALWTQSLRHSRCLIGHSS